MNSVAKANLFNPKPNEYDAMTGVRMSNFWDILLFVAEQNYINT